MVNVVAKLLRRGILARKKNMLNKNFDIYGSVLLIWIICIKMVVKDGTVSL